MSSWRIQSRGETCTESQWKCIAVTILSMSQGLRKSLRQSTGQRRNQLAKCSQKRKFVAEKQNENAHHHHHHGEPQNKSGSAASVFRRSPSQESLGQGLVCGLYGGVPCKTNLPQSKWSRSGPGTELSKDVASGTFLSASEMTALDFSAFPQATELIKKEDKVKTWWVKKSIQLSLYQPFFYGNYTQRVMTLFLLNSDENKERPF